MYAHGVRWPWGSKVRAAQTGALAPVDLLPTDQFQVLAAMLRPGGPGLYGIAVDEETALGVSAFFRAVSLIAGSLAQLPMPTYRDADGQRARVESIFDNPDGDDGQTVFEWKETAFLHLVMHGKTGARKIKNEAGGLARLELVHPLTFTERAYDKTRDQRRPRGGLWFDMTLADGTAVSYDADDFWYVPGMSLDGRTGVSLLTYARVSMATTIAGNEAAGRSFTNGAMISGVAVPADPDEDITDDLDQIRRDLDREFLGPENAGGIALTAARIKVQPLQMTLADAQFLQSRQFQVEEVSRWTGVPPHLLMQTEKQTSWGTGVEEQNRAMGRTVLGTWASRFEQRCSRLLARPRWVEFDFAGLERPSPEKEIELLLAQTGKPFLTVNEARAIRNLPPVAGGDVLDVAPAAPTEPPGGTNA